MSCCACSDGCPCLRSDPTKNVEVILGAQWGDEGKGKIVDTLAKDVDIVARCQGGNNAGNGVVMHLPGFFSELEKNNITALPSWEKRIIVSDRAHLVFDFHQEADGLQELKMADKKLGTTRRGIGPTYSSKYWRSGIRLAELMSNFDTFSAKFRNLADFFQRQFPSLTVDVESELRKYKEYAERLTKLQIVKDTVLYFSEAFAKDPPNRVLVEGANGTLLDVDFGTYPYVTSSNCSVGGVITGLGIPPNRLNNIIGVCKAYTTRVGDGPFPTEQVNSIGELLREKGHEYGVTTGRPRRCGWLDLVLLKYTHMINGFTKLAVTKLDVLDDFDTILVATGYKIDGKPIHSIPACEEDIRKLEVVYETVAGWKQNTKSITSFEKLPENAQKYIEMIERYTGIPGKV
ncbi:unnamed protein product [Soboliphyme baturini]|uniref:Adenylosuccinate synthetase n=1 Tax=Soboliphyme baturini TaxID=241478 RepID=A0A183IG12_9BILA|nr:unnamed protein product [Soboliphyme baturini]